MSRRPQAEAFGFRKDANFRRFVAKCNQRFNQTCSEIWPHRLAPGIVLTIS